MLTFFYQWNENFSIKSKATSNQDKRYIELTISLTVLCYMTTIEAASSLFVPTLFDHPAFYVHCTLWSKCYITFIRYQALVWIHFHLLASFWLIQVTFCGCTYKTDYWDKTYHFSKLACWGRGTHSYFNWATVDKHLANVGFASETSHSVSPKYLCHQSLIFKDFGKLSTYPLWLNDLEITTGNCAWRQKFYWLMKQMSIFNHFSV